MNYRALDNLTLSLMVNNVFNRMPDNQRFSFAGTSGQPYNNYLYNAYGRAISTCRPVRVRWPLIR